MQLKEHPDHERLLRRLAVVCDDGESYQVRLAVAGAVLDALPPSHPLRSRTSAELVTTVLDPWQTKTVWDPTRRGWTERTVARPPLTLADVWHL